MISQDKIDLTIRSLYRLSIMEELNCPSILTETEEKILESRIKELNEEETLYIENNLEDLITLRAIEYEIESSELDANFNVSIYGKRSI